MKEELPSGKSKPKLVALRPAAENLWELAVDEALISSSHERKYLAFELFEALLPHMDGGAP